MNIRLNKSVLIIASLFGLLLVGWLVYQQLVFRVVKTDPSTKSVSTISPFIKVYFSDEIDPSSVKVNDYGGLLDKETVSGKVLELSFARQLELDKEYSIIIAEVKNESGDILQNIKLDFVAKDIPLEELSDDQQQTILEEQDNIPYSVYSIDYVNFGALTDQGVSSGQLQDIKVALYSYSKKINKEFKTMTVDPASLRIVYPDPQARNPLASSATFSVNLGGQVFTVRTEYTGLEDSTFTRIYAPNGGQVFDNLTDQLHTN